MKPLVIANWKCNPTTLRQAKQLFNSVKRGLKNIKTRKAEVVICPPFVYLLNLLNSAESGITRSEATGLKSEILNLKLGAQNCFWEEKGAYTGEISPKMLKALGCQYVILGHSERRRYFGETDDQINKKIKAAIKAKLKPILCVGETEKERNQGETKKVLEEQLRKGLKSILNLLSPKATPRRVASEIHAPHRNKVSGAGLNLIIAYEPLWAIGTGKACPPEEVHIMNLLLQKILAQKYNQGIADKVRILYGGSVNSKNALSYIKEAHSQGLLIGGASLELKEFLAIVKKVSP